MTAKTPPLEGMVYEVIPTIDSEPDYSEANVRNFTLDVETATVITSRVAGQDVAIVNTPLERHKVVLDIDLPAELVPSSTEGHFHLYIDREVAWADYEELLWAMAKCGLIEDGYVSASVARGHTAARLPWVQKGAAAPAPASAF